MKKFLPLLACLLLLMACSKTVSVSEKDMENPIRFYYCSSDEEQYGGDSGALGWEAHDLGDELWTNEEILELYLQGPQSEQLWMPFDQKFYAGTCRLEDGVLIISVSEQYATLSPIQRSLAMACLVHTMTQLDAVESVQLIDGKNMIDIPLKSDDFILMDDTMTSNQTTVKLYFSDQDGRYLTEETRQHTFETEEEIPLFVIRQLLDGPQQKENTSPFPKNTKLYSVKVSEGVCTVNLSTEFVSNLSDDHNAARLAVFSLVNSLTELSQIEGVQILINGKGLRNYGGLDLDQLFYRDERAIGKKQADARAVDCTLWVPCGEQWIFAEVPVMIYRTAGRSLEMDLINELLSVEEMNGYRNPFPDGTMVMEVRVKGGVCTALFNSAFALADTDPEQAFQAVYSVVNTLCNLDGVDAVEILIHNGKMTSVDLSKALAPKTE